MKKIGKYIAHAWYVTNNWNIWMAFFMIFDNIRGTLKYGGGTFLPENLDRFKIARNDLGKASRYEAVSFYMLENLLGAFRKLSGETRIIDLGCGKGRVMMVAPHFGFEDIIGIDLAGELCELAGINMKKKEKEFPGLKWQVLHMHVEAYAISESDSVFFMFNPFHRETLSRFLDKLDASCTAFPRTVYFLYAGPEDQDLLLDRGFAVVYQKEKLYLRSLVAVRDE